MHLYLCALCVCVDARVSVGVVVCVCVQRAIGRNACLAYAFAAQHNVLKGAHRLPPICQSHAPSLTPLFTPLFTPPIIALSLPCSINGIAAGMRNTG